MRTLRTCILFLFTLVLALPAAAKDEVIWSLRLEPADARAGEHAQIVAEAKVAPDWHIYTIKPAPGGGPRPTKLELLPGSVLTATGPATEPVPHTEFDKGFKIDVTYFEKAVAFGVPVRVNPDASGPQKATVKIGWMVCKEGTCLPPTRIELPVEFTVAAGPARDDRKQPITTPPAQPSGYQPPAGGSPSGGAGAAGTTDGTAGQIAKVKAQGLLAFIGFAILMGFAALLTPCVFPMVPITVSFFSKQQENGGSSLKGAAAYSLGIIGTFTALGVLMAVLFGAASIGRLAANAYLNLGLAALFIFLALNLFGVVEIQLPSWLVERTQKGSQKGGFVGPLLMGLTFTLTSFTCTFGFVGGLLASATQGDLLWPIVGMLAFSTAFASPFFLLALFPSYLAKMPKSGSWLVTVKAFMGFLELAAALKFLSNVDLQWRLGYLTQPVFLAVWAMLFIIAGCYLYGWLKLPHDAEGRPGLFRLSFGTASLVFGVWCLAAMNGASLGKMTAFLPPRDYPYRNASHAGPSAGGLKWIKDYDQALAKAKEENKPLFIDFTGITCTNCREMEETVFIRPEVAEQFKNFITVSLYTDLEDDPRSEQYKKMQEQRYGTVELPLYVVVAPDESKIGQISYEPNPQKFVAFLQGAHATFAERAGATEVAQKP